MELLVLALPFLTSSLMFAYKRLAGLRMFLNGAEAHPWLRALLIGTSLIGVFATALLNGAQPDVTTVQGLLESFMVVIGTGLNAYLSHVFYQTLARN